ncbi:outer membrane beta-barrel protein [Seonamhaeicola aphaedonensis]|uniref:Carboxypeptidase-like protein n=1 Tax=Seonamhaeicola aphaedonensis TaxID=1461338 RepID=A0A3D9HFQ9_9FLAO|nr:outer membrane beta-barrel protein [Seonamhaeicola aphaedonensis]RED48318.1 carboxypeptidase-like protein [Seonamhaeicola aphaedonensis]
MKAQALFVLLLLSTSLFAQKFTLEGFVIDDKENKLEAATVFLQSVQDSLVLAYGITNKDGQFSIKVSTEEALVVILNVGYLGYKPYSKKIEVPKSDNWNVGFITLDEQIEELNAVSVIARAAPIVIKKDTIEYNADSFKTLPNDRAEDLLKKLPGIEIDIDGNITVNGIDVEAVNVDGMRFFGEKKGDIALKNLPSNVISKVQVTDFKTNMQKFTGEESDSGTKEINLKIKKGKNTAFFGDLNGGYGTDDKYQANANLFKLIDGKQLGLVSGSNNINMRRGFNALPNAQSSVGYIESDFLGANYTKGRWNETRVNGNYRFNSSNVDNAQKRIRQNFLPNLNYISETESESFRDTDNHIGNLDLKYIIDSKNEFSKNKVQLSNEFDFNSSDTDAFSKSTTSSRSNDGDLISDVNSNNQSTSGDKEFKNQIGIISRTGKGTDFFTLNLNTNFSKSNTESQNYSENILYERNRTRIQDQIRSTENTNTNINFNGMWFKQLFDNFRIIPKYNVTINHNNNEKYVFDFNEAEDDYTNFNDLQSFDSRYVTNTIRPGLRLRYDYNNLRFEIEGAYTNTYRKYTDQLIEARNFKADFEYFTYSGRIRYRDKNGYKNVNLNYRQNVDLPSASQLQPVEDVSNQTHIKIGNPFLKPEVNHILAFEYQNNLAYHNINITGNARAQFVEDKIVNSTVTDEDLIRNTTYTNVNGDYTLSGNTAISKSYFNKNTNLNFNLRFFASYRNNISLQNGVRFVSKNTTLRPSASFRYSYDSKLDLSATYSYSINDNVFDTDMFDDNNFFVQNVNVDATIFFLKNAFFANKISYRYNSRVGDEFDGDAVFWNAGLGVQLWDDKGTLTLVGYDVLGKNNGFNRSVTETYIQDVENRILEQYFMVTFVFKFGRIAGQNMNKRPRGIGQGQGFGGTRRSSGGMRRR